MTDFPKGISAFKPRENAPKFVKADISIKPGDFSAYLMTLTPNEKGYIRFQVKESQEGKFYIALDDWKPGETNDKGIKRTGEPVKGDDGGDVPF